MLTESTCEGKHCIVIGSAPGVCLRGYRDKDVIVCANGGAAIAIRREYPVDVLVTNCYLYRKSITPQEKSTLSSLQGAHVNKMWLLDHPSCSRQFCLMRLKELDITYDEITHVGQTIMDRVTRQVSGDPLRVSTGIWAACLCLTSGAASITLGGISLSNGHYGQPNDTQLRDHVREDKKCLQTLFTSGRVLAPRELKIQVAA